MGLNEIVAKSCSAAHLKEHSSLLCNSSAVQTKENESQITIQYMASNKNQNKNMHCLMYTRTT